MDIKYVKRMVGMLSIGMDGLSDQDKLVMIEDSLSTMGQRPNWGWEKKYWLWMVNALEKDKLSTAFLMALKKRYDIEKALRRLFI